MRDGARTGCEKQRSKRLQWAYGRKGLRLFTVWSSTTDGSEIILKGMDMDGNWIECGWGNGGG